MGVLWTQLVAKVVKTHTPLLGSMLLLVTVMGTGLLWSHLQFVVTEVGCGDTSL